VCEYAIARARREFTDDARRDRIRGALCITATVIARLEPGPDRLVGERVALQWRRQRAGFWA
jgi:hypothetical protein